MCLDHNRYRRALRPKDIFELLPRDIVEQMISGFFYRIKKGVTLLWSEYDPDQRKFFVPKERFDPFKYDGSDDRQHFNPVCWEYRQKCGPEKCHECDFRITREYVEGNRSGVSPYPCWLGLDDLAYPVVIGGQVRAVLFAGQIVPNDDRRVAAIEAKLRQECEPGLAEHFIGLLREERRKQWADPEYGENLAQRLSDFGQMFQEIVTRLYDATKKAAMQELLQTTEDKLASVPLDASERWWQACAEVTQSFAGLVGLDAVEMFTPREGDCIRRLAKRDISTAEILREAAQLLPVGQFQRVDRDEGAAQLADKLGFPPRHSHFYLSYATAERNVLSTLIVLLGELPDDVQELAASFCRILTQQADLRGLVALQRDAQRRYRGQVAEVAHDFRTPLQLMVFDLEELQHLAVVRKDTGLFERLSTSIRRALGAQEHVLRLICAPREQPKRLDLVKLVRDVMKEFTPLAARHPCRLKELEPRTQPVWVWAVEYQLRRALTNLVENAIKYSWKGKQGDIAFELHTVTVRVEMFKRHLVRVRISNYGVGIPPDLLEQVRQPGARGRVPDARGDRPGFGWGLPIAIRFLEEHSGWLGIRSEPADSSPRTKEEQYHRYVTTVDAYLPIVN